MSNTPVPPEGYSIPMPNTPPSDAQSMSPEEYEKRLLATIHQKEEALAEAYFNLVCFYSDMRRPELAIPYLERVIEINTDPVEQAHYLLSMGQLMEQRDDFILAIEFYKRAFAMKPADQGDWYLIHNNLGYSLNKLGRYAEGEPYCREAIRINPQRHNAYKNLGIALDGQGQFLEAAHNFIQATKMNAMDSRALQHLQDLLKRQPQLLIQHPELLKDLEDCRNATAFADRIIQSITEEYLKNQKD